MKKSNRQEPEGSSSDRLASLLKNTRHIRTHNKIMAPSISDMYKTDITQKCNGLHQKYVDITKIHIHQNAMEGNT